jgi:hypothetical protein
MQSFILRMLIMGAMEARNINTGSKGTQCMK